MSASTCTNPCVPVQYLRGKSGLSRVALALLAYVLEHPDKQGTRAEIAEECCCAANSIPRAAKKLEAEGLIEREPGGGTRNTTYRAGRNIQVTGSDERNMEVTAPVPSMLRAASSAPEPEMTTTHMVVTSGTGTRNIAPPDPLIITISTLEVEVPSDNPESSVLGGLGDFTLEAEEPKRSRRRRTITAKPATEANMPKVMSPKMTEDAAKRGFVNGTVAGMFEHWRDWHITKATEIADHEASWRMWCDKRVRWNEADAKAGKSGYKLAGVGADGKPRYNRKLQSYR